MFIVLTLIVVGIALLFLETVLPGLIAGVLGVLSLAGAVYLAYRDLGTGTGDVILLCTGFGLVAGVALWAKYFPRSRFAKVFISRKTIGDIEVEKPELVGQTGVAETTLRPSGIALIGGKRCDVVSEGAMIERGAAVKVMAVEGMRVVVRAV